MFSVKGRVAVVTDGGTGLGQGTIHSSLQRNAIYLPLNLTAAPALTINDAKVYITGRRLDVLEKSVSIQIFIT